MKKTILVCFALLLWQVSFNRCVSAESAKDLGSDIVKSTGQAVAQSVQKYTCPMHPEVLSDKPGKCPKCGMYLKKMSEGTTANIDKKSEKQSMSSGSPSKRSVPKTKKDNTSYQCPMHSEITSDKPAKCRKCGMPLEKK